MEEVLVSIIVPVFNVEKYIDKCLDSIIHQSYETYEVIIVNDGSTDSSLDICMNYVEKDERFVIVNKVNEGLSVARQVGIDRCKGDFFCTIDSDDYIEPDYLKKMLEAIMTNESDIALCAKAEFDCKGRVNPVLLNKSILGKNIMSKKKLEHRYSYYAGLYQMSDSWNKMYRTDFVRKTGVKFNLSSEYNGTDLLFNHQLLMHMPVIVAINDVLYNYRITQNSRVRRRNKHLERGFRIILDQLLLESERTINTNRMRNQIFAVYFSMLKYATQDYYEENRNNTRKEVVAGINEIMDSMPKWRIEETVAYIGCVPYKLRMFSFLMSSRFSMGIYIYYKIRDLIRGRTECAV